MKKETTITADTLSFLPQEIVVEFLNKLTPHELAIFSRVSKAREFSVNDDSLWLANINYYFGKLLDADEIASIMEYEVSNKRKFKIIYDKLFGGQNRKWFDDLFFNDLKEIHTVFPNKNNYEFTQFLEKTCDNFGYPIYLWVILLGKSEVLQKDVSASTREKILKNGIKNLHVTLLNYLETHSKFQSILIEHNSFLRELCTEGYTKALQWLDTQKQTANVLKDQHILTQYAAEGLQVETLEYLIFSKKLDPFFINPQSSRSSPDIFIDTCLDMAEQPKTNKELSEKLEKFFKLVERIIEQEKINNPNPDRNRGIAFVRWLKNYCKLMLSDTPSQEKQRVLVELSWHANELMDTFQKREKIASISRSFHNTYNALTTALLMTVGIVFLVVYRIYLGLSERSQSPTQLPSTQINSTSPQVDETLKESTEEDVLNPSAYKSDSLLSRRKSTKVKDELNNNNKDLSDESDNDSEDEFTQKPNQQ